MKAELARAVIKFQVDIGFGDHVFPKPKRQDFPSLLPELPTGRVLMYPPETVVAEKFEAMVRFGEANGRLKDYYDIWITIRTFAFELSNVVEAVGGTLRRRQTSAPDGIPVGLRESFVRTAEDRGLWSGFLRRNPPTLEPPPLSQIQAELRRFFGPVIAALGRPEASNVRWDPDRLFWES